MTAADRAEARALALEHDLSPGAWVVEERRDEAGSLLAVMVCSTPLGAHVWVAVDRGFHAADDLAVFYYDEFSELKTKSVEQLREIHRTKLIFPGARVIQ